MATVTQWLPQPEATDLAPEFCRFVARQPIVDRLRRSYGYELLFRNSWENRFCADGDKASRHMVDNALSFGLESLVGDAVPFMNCTRDTLLSGVAALLPTRCVLEILEDIPVDGDFVELCRELHAAGYALALDDYDFSPRWEPLLPFVAFIKVDFRTSDARQRLDAMRQLKQRPIRFVAEKIETQAEFKTALNEHFHLFQGYFFNKPQVVARPSLSAVVNRLRLMAELTSPSIDRNRILRLLREEPSISYRVLRMANSAAVAAREVVTSLGSALSLIGDEQFRKLATLALATEFSGGQSLESIRFILQRARFCELIGAHLGSESSEMYLLGMISVVRDALGLTTAELTSSMKLRPEVAEALDGVANAHGMLLQLATSAERAEWSAAASAQMGLRLSDATVADAMLAAQHWAEEIVSAG
jgi:EAL and modified HD-GYP domain-containing signal transduction protein